MSPRCNPSPTVHVPPFFPGLVSSLALVLALVGGEAARAQNPPNGVLWSTYLGGAGLDRTGSLVVADNGDVLVCGATDSVNFPVSLGAFQPTHGGGSSGTGLGDGVIVRLDPDQTGPNQGVWATYLGGSGQDRITGVITGASGAIIVCGITSSPNFPTTPGCLQATLQGPSDGFVAGFDAAGNLLWSTLFGGSGEDSVADVAVHPSGLVVIAGATSSANLPTTPGAFQPAPQGGTDGFVATLIANGSQLVACTYLGGSADDFSLASFVSAPYTRWFPLLTLRLDHAGNPIVVGGSESSTYPATGNAFQASFSGVVDGVLTRLDLGLTTANYSSFLGGASYDFPMGFDLTANGELVVSGSTRSPGFPTTPNAFARIYNGHAGCNPYYGDVFVTILDPALAPASQLVWSTFYGSPACDRADSMWVDRSGTITIVGGMILAQPAGTPTTPGAHNRTRRGAWDAFAVRFDPAASGSAQLRYATYLGGSNLDLAFAGEPDGLGNAVIVGITNSTNFPTTPGAFQTSPLGGYDGFATSLSLLPLGVTRFGTSTPACGWPIYQDVTSWPQAPNATFAIDVSGAPPNGAGLIAFGFPDWTGVPLPGFPAVDCFLGLPNLTSAFVQADAQGHAEFPVPIPATIPANPPHGFATQWFFLTTPQCPGSGPVASSEGLSW